MTRESLDRQLPNLIARTRNVVDTFPLPNTLLLLFPPYRDLYTRRMTQAIEPGTTTIFDIGNIISNESGLNPIETTFFNWSFSRHVLLEQLSLLGKRAPIEAVNQIRRSLNTGDMLLENETRNMSDKFIEAYVQKGIDRHLVEQWFESMERAGAHAATAFLGDISNCNADLILRITGRIAEMRTAMGIPEDLFPVYMLAALQYANRTNPNQQ